LQQGLREEEQLMVVSTDVPNQNHTHHHHPHTKHTQDAMARAKDQNQVDPSSNLTSSSY
jgi:hypothetical protein